ncbi:RidA family protein [Agarivorans sp. B2Z047]|uniref:Putative translation initiation inhibitor n=1 Tax=Agarivorans albus MKT 106 TaxID=1331007 RepID=R9PG29_AGAAL|nr:MULTISPECIES: RidA family protein [Agarivorans]MPW30361.1 RidA family protein [Agarivorans sp. B2Z047]UQN43010.1 RidA family protein [Agarivorans sp. B2Z047]GAD00213.1 putative translation initiation inhibitor [Agarivorans albus MKT 106]
MSIAERLLELGISLPKPTGPAASYSNCVQTGNLLYVSGKGPVAGLQEPPKGKIGREFTHQQGAQFARLAGLDILAAVQQHLGSLDRVSQVVKLQGFINATEQFEQHPAVLDGCSKLMVEVFGDKGLHARSVFGATSLRANLPLVIDSIFEVSE